MKSKVTQLSTYDETNSTWRQPIDIGAKAANVDLDIGNGSVRNIQGAIGEYTDSESIAEKIGHLDRTMDYDDWLLLSEEERNSGDWYIPDFPVSGTVVPIGPLEDMTGATGSTAGVHGLVPAPAATDNNKFLKGDGSWDLPSNITQLNEISTIQDNDILLLNRNNNPFKILASSLKDYIAIKIIKAYISSNSSQVISGLENNKSYLAICHTAGLFSMAIVRIASNGTINVLPVHENGVINYTVSGDNSDVLIIEYTGSSAIRVSLIEFY